MAKKLRAQRRKVRAPPDEPDVGAGTEAPRLEPSQSSTKANGADAMSDTHAHPRAACRKRIRGDHWRRRGDPTLFARRAGEETQGGIATWLNNKRVARLWGINQNRNSWVYVTGVGWKRLANNSDTAVVALTTLAASAKFTQTNYNYREEADHMIYETYVW